MVALEILLIEILVSYSEYVDIQSSYLHPITGLQSSPLGLVHEHLYMHDNHKAMVAEDHLVHSMWYPLVYFHHHHWVLEAMHVILFSFLIL